MAHPAPRKALQAGVRHVVRYDGTSLSIDGRLTPIWAAQLHYWRLPAPNLWRDAFRKVKAAGYNAVALDFFWGYHSPRPGAYDFTGCLLYTSLAALRLLLSTGATLPAPIVLFNTATSLKYAPRE